MQVSGLFLQSYQSSCSKHTDTAEMGEANGDRLQNRCMTFATASWKWGQCKFAQKYQPRFPGYFPTFTCYIFDGVTFVRKIFGVFSFTICNLRSACLQSAVSKCHTPLQNIFLKAAMMGEVTYRVARVTKTSKREMQKGRKRLHYTTVEDSIILQQKLAKRFLTSRVNIARFLVKKLAANIKTLKQSKIKRHTR